MKLYNYKLLVLFAIALGFAKFSQAETYQLDLASSIDIAKMRSYDMLMLKQDLKIAEYRLKSATSRYKTHIDLDMVAPNLSNNVIYREISGGVDIIETNQFNYGANIQIYQPLPTDGRIYVTSSIDNTDYLLRDQRAYRLNSRIGISQPVNSLFGYNRIKASLRNAQLNYETSQKRLKRNELNLVYDVSSQFYNLLSLQKRKEIALLNLERQKEAYEIAQNKYQAGLIREVDALQMEVDLAEAQNNYDLSIINMNSSLNGFKEVLGLEYSDSIVLSSQLNYEKVIVDTQKAIDLALLNRLEIREQEINIERNEISLKEIKSNGRISGNLDAYFQNYGNSSDEYGMSRQGAFQQAVDSYKLGNQSFGVGFTVSVPIFDWGENKALVRAQEASLKQTEYQLEIVKRQIEREVLNLVADLNSSLQRLQLLEKNVAVAEKSFEITRLRYADGDIDSQALALERERLNNANVSHLNAFRSYQLLLADLTRKTFYDFKTNTPIN